MAKKKATPKKPAGTDLTCLSQAEAARLIGKPAVWLRDNVHLDGRNQDGTYDARELVQQVVSDYQPARLSDDETEVALKAFDAIGIDIPSPLVESLERIAKRHGAAGLAAIGQVIIEEISKHVRPPRTASADEIRAKAEAEIAALPRQRMIDEGRYVAKCYRCNRYRWGTEWRHEPRHDDLPETDDVCPECYNR